ncbi:MAG TPA: hypothetical protein VNA26_05960 [Chitinophagaceae bacterium]|nr:hypothetical protein [Chitinophagaceae bacterium]
MKPKKLIVKFTRINTVSIVGFLTILCCSFFISAPKQNLTIDLYYQSQLKKLQTELGSLKQLCLANAELTAMK